MVDQTENIRVLEECLKKQLRPGWDIRANWKFGNLCVDIVAVHPTVGLVIFKVATLPAEYSFEERDASLHVTSSSQQEYNVDLLADPREEIRGWTEDVETLVQSSLPNRFQNYVLPALIVFQSGEKAKKNMDHLAKTFRKKVGKIKVRCELIDQTSKLIGIATRLIPADKEVAADDVPEQLWKRIQKEIMGDPLLIVGELPPPMNDFDGEQVKFMQRVEVESLSRLRGPAGSGKSTVIARLAADSVLQEKKVLIVARNKSMATYLRDRIRRYVVQSSTSDDELRSLLTRCNRLAIVTHQEDWWKMVFLHTGFLSKSNKQYVNDIQKSEKVEKLIIGQYKSLKSAESEEHARELLDLIRSAESQKRAYDLAIEKNQLELLKSAIERLQKFNHTELIFDFVIIDEAQNMLVENWNVMKTMVSKDVGKVVVVADPSQSLYGQRPWTNKSMPGFRGPWSKLSGSHRLPINCVELVHDFNKAFPSVGEVVLPEFPTELDFFPDAKLLRIAKSSTPGAIPADAIADAVFYMRDHGGFAPYEIVFLVPSNHRGFMVVNKLLARDPEIKITTSFNRETRHELGIGMGVRGSTIHSFAGWESPCVILDLGVATATEDPNTQIYSALTRVRKRKAGSALVVIDRENQYSEFFKQRTQTLEV